jgi:hypothetical protein
LYFCHLGEFANAGVMSAVEEKRTACFLARGEAKVTFNALLR